jgi:hypothetical protein
MENEIEAIRARINTLQLVVDDNAKKFDSEWFTEANRDKMLVLPDWGQSKYVEEKAKFLSPEGDELYLLKTKERMMRDPVFEDVPNYGDVMLLKEFIEHVNSGGFIDYDGHGKYVRDNRMSDIYIYPSDIKRGNVRKDFDTIVWFNR